MDRRKTQRSPQTVFAPGGFAAAQVAHGLVVAQNQRSVRVKVGVDVLQTLLHILVYGGFGNAELFGRSPYGRPVLDDVSCQFAGTLLDSVFHEKSTSPKMCKLVDDMRGGGAKDGDCHFPAVVIG